jgi:hypothetical protein
MRVGDIDDKERAGEKIRWQRRSRTGEVVAELFGVAA